MKGSSIIVIHERQMPIKTTEKTKQILHPILCKSDRKKELLVRRKRASMLSKLQGKFVLHS